MDAIEARWTEFERRAFPAGVGGQEVAGLDLAEVDACAAGCISTYVSNGGQLDRGRLLVLRRCAGDLDLAISRLSGEAKVYFTELHELTRDVLDRSPV